MLERVVSFYVWRGKDITSYVVWMFILKSTLKKFFQKIENPLWGIQTRFLSIVHLQGHIQGQIQRLKSLPLRLCPIKVRPQT